MSVLFVYMRVKRKRAFFFNALVRWKKVRSCNSLLSERIFNHKICHTLVKIPLTSLVPANFLLWCSQRAAGRHPCTHSHTHTHTYTSAHPQSKTNLHWQSVETPCNLGFEPQNPRYIHLRHSLRSYLTQKHKCVCLSHWLVVFMTW